MVESKLNSVKSNIASNFAGRIVAAVLGIIFVPVYLRYLSVEMYGIIGFFTSIQAFLSLLDGGISPTLTREVAKLSALPDKTQELRNLSRTLEILCWATALIVCVIAMAASPAAADYWLKSETISTETVRDALLIMSITFAFQWSAGFYTGGMYGLQEQKLLNIINIFSAFTRSVGAFLVLAFISPTIKAFLLWQLIVAVFNCFFLLMFFWKKLPLSPEKPRFKLNLLKEVWRYAAGMAGTSLVVMILNQTDKVILSKILTLEDFGYYALATTLANTGLGVIIGSIQTAYFPQFSRLVAQNKIEEMRSFYHRACQVMSFFLIPCASVLAVFSYEILLIWTRKPEIAANAYLLLTLVAIGTGLNGLMHLPYYAQLAFGITKIGFWQNVIAIIFLVPFMIFATLHYGAVGGALSWAILNFSYTIFGLQFMHRLILKGELKKWYLVDVGLPLLTVLFLNGIAYLILNRETFISTSMIQTFAFITAVLSAAFAGAMVSIPAIRQFGMKKLFGV